MPRNTTRHRRESFRTEDMVEVNTQQHVLNRPLNIGTLREFDVEKDDWSLYQEQMDQYFESNCIDDQKKVSVLITCMGCCAYRYLRDLCDPRLPKDLSYVEICASMKRQFSLRLSTFKERIKFYELTQTECEPIRSWFLRVKRSASSCLFGALLEDFLKDRFVCGLLDGPLRDRLCEEDPKNRSLVDLYELALSRECIKKPVQSEDVCKVSTRRDHYRVPKKKAALTKSVTNNQVRCPVCGNNNHHDPNLCRFKSYRCRKCGLVGHLQRVCKKQIIQAIEDDERNSVPEEFKSVKEVYYNMNRVDIMEVSLLDNVEPMIANVIIDGHPLKMEIDTGSGVSLIPASIYFKLFHNFALRPTYSKLKSFVGEIVKPLGILEIPVEWSGQTMVCPLIVVNKDIKPLLGRGWLKRFGRLGLPDVNTIDVTHKDLELLIDRYKDLFLPEIGCYKFGKVSMPLKNGTKPRFLNPRPIPFAFREQVEEELDRLEKTGMIEKVEYSDWGTPLVPVLKPNGKIRICANYKITVNPHLEDVSYPLPRIEEIWANLQGGKTFTKLDFCQAYNQLELDEDAKMLLAWSTHRGTYKVNRLTFGPKTAVAIFQSKVAQALQGLRGVANFLDDIVVTGRNQEEHIRNLEEVFRRLSQAGFRFNLDKCEFFQKEINYLGHVISADGIRKDPAKIVALKSCQRPTNVSEVRAFLGMVNYFGKFIPNLSDLLNPLNNLLRKDIRYHWSEVCETAFNRIKEAITSDITLTHFNPDIPLALFCDASMIGLGAVLMHEFPDGSRKPIAFASRTLNSAERNYSMIQKEALAIFWAIKKFHQYLMGAKFLLYSDHKPLQVLFGDKKGIPEMAAGRLQRWALFVSGFNYEIKYVPSSKNVADFMSRLPMKLPLEENKSEIEYIHLIDAALPISLKEIKVETRKDPILSKIFAYVRDGWPESVAPEFVPYFIRRVELSIESDVLMWGYRILVPQKFRVRLLNELHSTHQGMVKMKSRARSYFWWPSLDSEIEKFVKGCQPCMSTQQQPQKCTGTWVTTKVPFERVHVDFAGPLRNKHFLILTDAYSKWPEVCEVSSTSAEVAISKLREIFARMGLPITLVSDNGAQFTSALFKDFCENNTIQHVFSPPFHPSSNKAGENSVKSFKRGLLKHLADSQKQKVSLTTALSRYLFYYRTSVHCTTGETPAKRMFGRELRTRFDCLKPLAPENKSRSSPLARNVTFLTGEEVYTRDYRDAAGGTKWCKATVLGREGSLVYLVRPGGSELTWRRHLDQLVKIFGTGPPAEEGLEEAGKEGT